MTQQEFKPHAFITLSNMGGIEIMLNRSNDGVYYRFNYGQDLSKEKIYESQIFYTEPDGEPFFKRGRASYMLSEAMRIQ